MSSDLNNVEHDGGKDQSEIISVISHQIRSPLATIRLANQTLLGDGSENLTEQQINLIKQSDKRAARIYELTEELLKASHDTSVGRDVVTSLGSVEELIEELRSELSVAINAKELQFLFNRDDMSRAISFDSSLLSDAITNLLDNAISYTPHGGIVKVETKYKLDSVTITISDTGPGVPKVDEDKLFRKFSRLEGASEHHAGGLGLGLFIAKESVEKHGGTLTYKPNQPHGASFIITLPITS